MNTIETNAVISQTGRLLIQLQTDISPGKYPVILVIKNSPQFITMRNHSNLDAMRWG